jgi:hypothetical protein
MMGRMGLVRIIGGQHTVGLAVFLIHALCSPYR